MSAETPVNREQLELLSKDSVPNFSKFSDKKKNRACHYKEKCSNCMAETAKVCDEIYHGFQSINVKKRVRKVFSLETLKNHLPIIKWLPKYRLRHLQGDLIAGLTVGLTVIPQSLAYAKIAELPPQYGLYTAFMCYFAYVFLGTARDVNLGPTAVMSLLTAEFAHSNVALATFLAFFSGVIQIAMGVFHVGFLIDYISHPVINSFMTAAAITIACSQVKKWLGLQGVPREFVQQFYWTFKKLPDTRIFDFVLGLVCMIILYILKKIKEIKWNGESTSLLQVVGKKIVWILSTGRNAIIVIMSAGLSAILLHHDIEPFTLTGNITSGIPPFRPPEFTIETENATMSTAECFEKIGIGIIIGPLVGVIELIAIGKAFGRKNGYNIDGNQELLALGAANVLGSFVSAYPVTASFSRSAVLAQSGVRTTAANIFTGAMVLLALAFLTPLFYYIPNAALAAVIIMAVTDMIDFSMIKHLWIISRIDLFPWCATFFISLLAGFEYGIIIGIVSSLLLLLYPWARPSIKTKSLSDNDEVIKISPNNVIIVSIPMGLMFPGVDYLQEQVEAAGSSARTVIIDFLHVFKMDYTAVMGVKELHSYMKKKEIALVLANVLPSVSQQLQKAKMKDLLCATSVDEALHLIAEGGLQRQNSMIKIIDADNINLMCRSLPTLSDQKFESSLAPKFKTSGSVDCVDFAKKQDGHQVLK